MPEIEKKNLMPYFSICNVSDPRNSEIWIGLHTTDPQGTQLEWADCSPMSWTQWHPSEPKDPIIYKCAYLKSVSANFWTGDCGDPKYFICENVDVSKLTEREENKS